MQFKSIKRQSEMITPRFTQTNDGKKFEDTIYNLLALRGVQNLVREKQFGSKKADIYFEIISFGNRRRFAVECKDYTETLTQKAISNIYSGYMGLFAPTTITDLLIVSNGRLAPSAQSYVDSVPNLSYQTFIDLRNSLIDLNSYLYGFKERFMSDTTFNYYIDMEATRLEDDATPRPSRDARSLLLARITEAKKPIIVFGAYGIGKTTLAKKLFLDLLLSREADERRPTPIYFSLDRMTMEQSLEGLLGQQCLATVAVCFICMIALIRRFRLEPDPLFVAIMLLEKYGTYKVRHAQSSRRIKVGNSREFTFDPVIYSLRKYMVEKIDGDIIKSSEIVTYIMNNLPLRGLFNNWSARPRFEEIAAGAAEISLPKGTIGASFSSFLKRTTIRQSSGIWETRGSKSEERP
jgi:hypothetical protein